MFNKYEGFIYFHIFGILQRIMNRLILRSGHHLLAPSSKLSVLRASLYSDAFLCLDVTRNNISKQKLLVTDPSQVKEKIKSEFQQSGVRNIFNEEINRLLYFSVTTEDMDFSRKIIVAQLQDSLHCLDLENLYYKLQLFFEMCHINNIPWEAIKCWNEPEVRACIMYKKRIVRTFLDLLFENELYQELLEEFNRDPEGYSKLPGQSPLVLAAMSYYKIGCRESLKEGLKLMNLMDPARLSRSRAVNAVSLLAFNLGEYSLAQSLLMKQRKLQVQERLKHTSFNDNLQVLVLVKTGKLQEAVRQFRLSFLPTSSVISRRVYYCVVSELLTAVRESQDEQLYRELMKMVLVIEKSDQVFVSNESLEEGIMRTIDIFRPELMNNNKHK